MMDSKHTPGPWKIDGGIVRGWSTDHERPICEIYREVRSSDATLANAALIAAAPQLLEALENADTFFEGSENDGCMAHRMIIDAIAAAKGNAS